MGNKVNKIVNDQVNKMRFLKIFLMFGLMVSSCYSEVIKMREGPIKTRISCKQLNRISVKNDRIESISGLEEAFSFEKNEKTGDGYIKPSEANGYEPIAISLTTVSGRTQELILNVDDGDPNTIILENDEKEDSFEEEFSNESVSDGGYSGTSTSSDYETGIVESMKKLISGECRAIKKMVASGTDSVTDTDIEQLGLSENQTSSLKEAKVELKKKELVGLEKLSRMTDSLREGYGVGGFGKADQLKFLELMVPKKESGETSVKDWLTMGAKLNITATSYQLTNRLLGTALRSDNAELVAKSVEDYKFARNINSKLIGQISDDEEFITRGLYPHI